MDNFISLFNSYKHYNPTGYSPLPVEFIKRGILSIFDRKNSSKSDFGSISEEEFNSVSEKQYNKYVSQMEAYYKKMSMRELEYHIPTYEELGEMLKGGESSPMGRKIITPSEIEEPILPDAKIGQTNQARSGNCYQIASDTALDTTPAGQIALRRSIKKSYDPKKQGYYVTLYGAINKKGEYEPRTYFISQNELKKAQETYVDMGSQDGSVEKNAKKYTSGDADTVLLDLATERYRREKNITLLTKNTKEVKGYPDYLSSGWPDEHMATITGAEPHYDYYVREDASYEIDNSPKINNSPKIDNSPKMKRTYPCEIKETNDIIPRLRYLYKNRNKIAGASTFGYNKAKDKKEFEKYGLIENHAYTIKTIDFNNNTVTIINPHYGKNKPLIIPMRIYEKYCQTIQYVDLSKKVGDNYKKDNPQAKKVAQDIYNQISGPSRNKVTIQKLQKIDKYNAAQVVKEYAKISRKESLAEAIDNEWRLDIKTVKTYVCGPLFKQAEAVGLKINYEYYNKCKDIKSLNKFINKLVEMIYKKLK